MVRDQGQTLLRIGNISYRSYRPVTVLAAGAAYTCSRPGTPRAGLVGWALAEMICESLDHRYVNDLGLPEPVGWKDPCLRPAASVAARSGSCLEGGGERRHDRGPVL